MPRGGRRLSLHVERRAVVPGESRPSRVGMLRRLLAEQLEPVTTLLARLDARWDETLDLYTLRARVHAGIVPYAPREVLIAAGSLTQPYIDATAALERAGLASNDDAARAREWATMATSATLSWVAGDALTGAPPRTVARRAAALVGRSVLRYASLSLRGEVSLPGTQTTCPYCGGSADLALTAAGTRTLVCARCDASWRTDARGCLGCRATTAPALATVRAVDTEYALLLCHVCGRYLKERETESGAVPDLVLERMLTEEMDVAAQQRGLRL